MATKPTVMDLRRTGDPPRRVSVSSARPSDKETPKTRKPLRKRRRNARMLIVVSILLCLGVVAYGIHWLSYRPSYSIQTLKIIGAQNIPENAIRDHVRNLIYPSSASFISPANLYTYSPTQISHSLVGTFPRIASAKVFRDLSQDNAVSVSIVERRSFALWCDAACYVMDEYGFIFAPAALDTHTDTGYIFGGDKTAGDSPIGHLYASEHFEALLVLMKKLKLEGFAPRGITIDNDHDFAVPLGAGFLVKATFGEDAVSLVRNLNLVLTSDAIRTATSTLEYIDLRFGDRVYYKMQVDIKASRVMR